MFYFVLLGMAASGAYVANQMHRHNKFMDTLHEAFNNGEDINTYQTFKNFDESKPWDYGFQSMIVRV